MGAPLAQGSLIVGRILGPLSQGCFIAWPPGVLFDLRKSFVIPVHLLLLPPGRGGGGGHDGSGRRRRKGKGRKIRSRGRRKTQEDHEQGKEGLFGAS